MASSTTTDEVSFARAFLAAAEGKQIRYGDDYVAPASQWSSRISLPPMKHAKRNRTAREEQNSVKISVKSIRPPPLNLTFDNISRTEPIAVMKSRIAQSLELAPSSIRLLHNKKTIPDSGTMQEVCGDANDGVIHVMIMKVPAAPATSAPIAAESDTQSGTIPKSGSQQTDQSVADTEMFWSELRRFLENKTKSVDANHLLNIFQGAYTGQKSHS